MVLVNILLLQCIGLNEIMISDLVASVTDNQSLHLLVLSTCTYFVVFTSVIMLNQNSRVSIYIVTPYILNEYSIEIGLKQHWLGR